MVLTHLDPRPDGRVVDSSAFLAFLLDRSIFVEGDVVMANVDGSVDVASADSQLAQAWLDFPVPADPVPPVTAAQLIDEANAIGTVEELRTFLVGRVIPLLFPAG